MTPQVRIHSWGRAKIRAITLVRELSGYGLAQAKEAVESGAWFPARSSALERCCDQLREIGCEIEVEGQGRAASAEVGEPSNSPPAVTPGRSASDMAADDDDDGDDDDDDF